MGSKTKKLSDAFKKMVSKHTDEDLVSLMRDTKKSLENETDNFIKASRDYRQYGKTTKETEKSTFKEYLNKTPTKKQTRDSIFSMDVDAEKYFKGNFDSPSKLHPYGTEYNDYEKDKIKLNKDYSSYSIGFHENWDSGGLSNPVNIEKDKRNRRRLDEFIGKIRMNPPNSPSNQANKIRKLRMMYKTYSTEASRRKIKIED